MKLLRSLIIAAVTAAIGVALAQTESPAMPSAGPVAGESSAPADTAAMYDHVLDLMRQVREAQAANPVDDATYYPLVYDAASEAMLVMDMVAPGSQRHYAMMEVLRNLCTPLEAGAFYYSTLNDREGLAKFARKFIDLRIHPAFKNEKLPYDAGVYHIMAYNAASDAYNRKEYDRAIEYFKVYFSTGEQSQRETVYTFMGQAAINLHNYDLAVQTLREGVKKYPSNDLLRKLALQACMEGNRAEYIEELVNDGLTIDTSNAKYMEIKGCLLEDNLDFLGALAQFQALDGVDPGKLSTAKHIALCYYNAAVNLFNEAQTVAKDDKEAGKMRRKARNYFAAAAQKMEEILASDPTNVRYLRSLGVSYLCMEQKDLFQEVNNKLKAMGEDPLANVFMPPMMAYEGSGRKNFKYGGTNVGDTQVPLYSEFGRRYVTEALTRWAPKGEFESVEAYQERVGARSLKAEYDRLSREAQEKYIKDYSSQLRLSDVKLQPYDVRSESFRIDTNFGPFYLKVPNKDNEAELFKANWEGARFLNTQFCIMDDKVQIASITVLSPNGRQYAYSNDRTVDYQVPDLSVDMEAIIAASGIGGAAQQGQDDRRGAQGATVITALSDVDRDIPENKPESTNKLVLIIANENYDNVAKVDAAYHDGKRFHDYCVKTLGIPENNVSFSPNVSLGKMRSEIRQLENAVASFGEPVDVIVYYAGHGMPDNATKDAYLLPVDGDPQLPSETGLSLDSFYKRLSEMNARSVSVFLDACFSGARRDGEMLTSARAVVIQPKTAAPKGNMFILSAACGQETALPYVEKNHGMFTYYLLKKLQESKGNATLKEIADYVKANVSRQSALVNKKNQTPTVQLSGKMGDDYKSKKLRGK